MAVKCCVVRACKSERKTFIDYFKHYKKLLMVIKRVQIGAVK